MAISWGAYDRNLRIGIEIVQSPATVTAGATSVTLTARYFIGSQPGYQNWGLGATLHFGGAVGGSLVFDYDSRSQNATAHKITEHSITVPTQFANAVRKDFTANVSGWYEGRAPRASASWTVPARPYLAPNTPSYGSATRVSDTQANLSWSVSTDSTRPINGMHVERQLNAGPWVRVANLPGSARSWTDTGILPDGSYQYRVFGSNGQEGGARVIGTVITTPAPPVNVVATRSGNGIIRVSWTKNSSVPAGGFDIYDNGRKVGSATGSATYYDHSVGAESGAHRYTVRQRTSSGLESADSLASNTVNLAGPPNAPELIGAVGDAEPVGSRPRFAWRHNPVDASEQTAYQLRYRRSSSSWTTTGITYGNAAEFPSYSAPLLTAGMWEWQVRTWGAHKSGQEAGASPWSAVASFRATNKPVVGFYSPSTSYQQARLTPSWSYSQAEGAAQTSAEIQLLQGGNIVEEYVVNGNATSKPFSTLLENGSQWVVRLRAKSAYGLWSDWIERSFTVAYPQPAAPTISTNWIEESGAISVTVTNPYVGGKPSVTGNNLYRKLGDLPWELVAENIASGYTYLERSCVTKGENRYRVEAFTSLGASATTETVVEVESPRIWVNAGPGFEIALSILMRPAVARSAGLVNRTLHRFAGRPLPVEFAGVQRSRKVSFSGLIRKSAEVEAWETVAQMAGAVLYRDFHGARLFGSLSNVSASHYADDLWAIQGEIEEVDYAE